MAITLLVVGGAIVGGAVGSGAGYLVAGAVVGAVAGGLLGSESKHSDAEAKKNSNVPGAAPGAPDPGVSAAQAEQNVADRRRAAIAYGGADTQVANFGGSVPSANLQAHSLLGE